MSLMGDGTQNLLMSLLVIYVSFWKDFYSESRHILNWVICLFVIELWEFFIYSRLQCFLRYVNCSLSSHSMSHLLNFLTASILAKSSLFACVSAIGVLDKGTQPSPWPWRFTSVFSSQSFVSLNYLILICFELLLYMVWGRVQVHCFLCGYSFISEPFVEKRILLPFRGVGTLFKIDWPQKGWFLGLNSIPSVYMCVLYYFILHLEIAECQTSKCALVFKIVLATPGPSSAYWS